MSEVSGESLRRDLHSGYSFLRGLEQNRSTAALTLDHLIDEQIRSISGSESSEAVDARGERRGVSKIDALTALEDRIKKAVKAVRDAGNDRDKLEALGLEPEPQEGA